jgi:urease accessory protein UreF
VSNLAALLQVAEAGFRAGGFGHSFGLETAIVDGRVHDGPTLRHARQRSDDVAAARRRDAGDGAAVVTLPEG